MIITAEAAPFGDWTPTTASARGRQRPTAAAATEQMNRIYRHRRHIGDQNGLPRWLRALSRAWLARVHMTPRDSLEATLSVLAARTGAKLAIERPYGGHVQYAVAEAAG